MFFADSASPNSALFPEGGVGGVPSVWCRSGSDAERALEVIAGERPTVFFAGADALTREFSWQSGDAERRLGTLVAPATACSRRSAAARPSSTRAAVERLTGMELDVRWSASKEELQELTYAPKTPTWPHARQRRRPVFACHGLEGAVLMDLYAGRAPVG